MSGRSRNEVTMDWRRRYNKKRHNLYSSLYIVTVIKELILRQIAQLGESTMRMIKASLIAGIRNDNNSITVK
jgi:hypothetical protein